jgi:hypothetical protein
VFFAYEGGIDAFGDLELPGVVYLFFAGVMSFPDCRIKTSPRTGRNAVKNRLYSRIHWIPIKATMKNNV